MNDIVKFDSQAMKWDNLELNGDSPSEGRFGHTLTAYGRTLLLFGGEKNSNSSSN